MSNLAKVSISARSLVTTMMAGMEADICRTSPATWDRAADVIHGAALYADSPEDKAYLAWCRDLCREMAKIAARKS